MAPLAVRVPLPPYTHAPNREAHVARGWLGWPSSAKSERMNRILRLIATLVVLVTATASAPASEIVLEHSAVDKMLAQAMFKNAGRFDLKKGPCYAYLENPTIEMKDGRIRIRSHLSSRLGVESGAGSCIGVGLASWAVVSGRPTSRGGVVTLEDLRIDNVDDAATQMILESGLLPALPRAIELDVMKAVREMLQGDGTQLRATVEYLRIDSISAADDKLSVKFDFKLVAR
jgi:hypothetical protein